MSAKCDRAGALELPRSESGSLRHHHRHFDRQWTVRVDSAKQGTPKLPTHQRYEQSGFTLVVDRILAIRVLTERLRDFRNGLLAAYVNLRKVFDLVNREVLWRMLALC